MGLYNINILKNGQNVSMETYKNKVLLVVNVASKCGFTNQYEGLQELKNQFKDQEFEILAFPCNQFGAQEKGTNEEIQQFCTGRFGVTFPVMDKIEVNGDNTSDLYVYLKKEKPGLLGSQKIKWNFTKFLIDKNGQVVERYAPQTTPDKLVDKVKSLF